MKPLFPYKPRKVSLATLWCASMVPFAALANPVGGNVSAGSASIATNGATLTVTQATDKAIIDWQGFDIGAAETTRFAQPSSHALTLNRVSSAQASKIDGNLIANGNVMIVNPNGVVFGAGSHVDVNSLVVSSADISNDNFMAGNFKFDRPGAANATIENRGQITAAEAGLVGLVAPNVLNSGVIQARLGRIHLASGDTATIDLYGDGLMEVQASGALQSQLVDNTGKLLAQGGTIALTAAEAANQIHSLIHVGGELNATSVAKHQGHILIYAAGSNAVGGNNTADKGKKTGQSNVVVDGKLNVSNRHGAGGAIRIAADQVTIKSTAVLNANGTKGGGTINIGGDLHGGTTSSPLTPLTDASAVTPTALYTMVESGALITASATVAGNGGTVSVWADERTEFDGRIEANGAGENGQGGMVETSGRVALLINGGSVSAAGRRRQGEWLLDPSDITVTASNNGNVTASTPFTATATGSQVSAATIKAALDGGTSVTISTGSDTYAGSGDIIVSSAISTTGSGSLTLSAYRDINVNASITLQSGALTLRSDNAGNGIGAVNVAAALTTGGGAITIGGGNGTIAGATLNADGSIQTAASGFATGDAQHAAGVSILSAINAAGGNIIVNGKGYNSAANNVGVNIDNTSVSTNGNGTININGAAQGITNINNDDGVFIHNGAVISTANNALIVTGIGGGAGSGGSNAGVHVTDTNSAIKTTGSGALNVVGTGGDVAGTGNNNYGVVIQNAASINASGGGNITVIGTGGANTASSNHGIYVGDSSGSVFASITNTGTGTLSLSGTGGGAGAGSGDNTGVFVNNGGIVSANNALNVNGLGGGAGGGGSNYGVRVSGNGSTITTSGALTVNGTGGNASGSGDNNIGVIVQNAASVTATGSSNAIVNGIGGASSGNGNDGIYVGDTSSGVSGSITHTGAGTLTLNGTGAGSGNSSNDYGVFLKDGGTVSTAHNTLTVNGTGGGAGSGGSNHGVYLTDTNSAIKTTGTGALNVSGTGGDTGGSGNFNYGVLVQIAASITANGGGNITVNGTGGASSGGNSIGIYVGDSSGGVFGSITNASTGTLTLNGTGAGIGNSNNDDGILVTNGGIVSTIDTALTVSGTGGGAGSGGNNAGVHVNGAGSIIETTGAGALNVSGNGGGVGGTGNNNYGVLVQSAANITATGSGNVSVTGSGGASNGSGNHGIYVGDTSSGVGAAITNAGSGTLMVSGTGGGAGAGSGDNNGVFVNNGGIVSTVDSILTLTGAGGGAGGGGNNNGVRVAGTGSTIKTTGAGALKVTGFGGNVSGTGDPNHGIYSSVANGITTTSGSGSVILKGVKGGQSDSYGLYEDTTNGINTSGTGNITAYTDTLFLNASNNITAAGTLTLAPYTDIGTSVGSNVANTLNISDSYIGYINAPSFVFGAVTVGNGSAGTSDVTINTAHDFGDSNVSFIAGRDVNLAATLSKASGTGTATYLLQANRTVVLASSKNINATSGPVNVVLTSDADNNSVGSTAFNGNSISTNGGSITLNGPSILNADQTLTSAGGNVTLNGAVDGDVAGTRSLTINAGTGQFASVGIIGGGNALNNFSVASGGASIGGNATASSILVQATGATADITIASGKTLTATGTGNALVLTAGRNFINHSTSAALSTANGRWLVYSTDPANNNRGGLLPNASDFNETYAANAPATIGSGNRFIYSRVTAPTITFTVANDTVTYGNSYTPNPGYSYTSGLVGGDSLSSIGLSGTLTYATSYVTGTTNASATPYSGMITATGSFSSVLGYQFSYAAGNLTVTKRNLTVTVDNKTKNVSDPDPMFTGSANLIASDIAQVTFTYAPISYSGAVGTYTIAATESDPMHRLDNYNLSEIDGVFDVRANPYIPPPPYTPPAAQISLPDSVLHASQTPPSIDTGICESDSAATFTSRQRSAYFYIPSLNRTTAEKLELPSFLEIDQALKTQFGIRQSI